MFGDEERLLILVFVGDGLGNFLPRLQVACNFRTYLDNSFDFPLYVFSLSSFYSISYPLVTEDT